jgi:hypothetical protein
MSHAIGVKVTEEKARLCIPNARQAQTPGTFSVKDSLGWSDLLKHLR